MLSKQDEKLNQFMMQASPRVEKAADSGAAETLSTVKKCENENENEI